MKAAGNILVGLNRKKQPGASGSKKTCCLHVSINGYVKKSNFNMGKHSRQVFGFDPMFIDVDVSLNKTIALKGILRFGSKP